MKKKFIPILFASFLFLNNCGSTIAIVKKDEWEREQQELSAMRDDMQKLKMQMDNMKKENEQQLKLMKADLSQLFTDMSHNLNLISGQMEESKNDLQKLSKTTEKLSERKYVIKNAGRTPGDTTAGDSVMTEDKLDVQKLLQIAKRDMNAKDYDRAQKEFEEIVAKFPSDPAAADCEYWIAEIFFVKKQYKEAVAKYKDMSKNYPNSPLIPSAVFKAGLCYQKLNDKENMKKAWNDLIAKYPYSDEAMQAKARINQ